MVNIRFLKGPYGFEEAEFIEHAGDKLVCASVSALGMTLIGALDHFGASYGQREYDSGNINIKISPFHDPQLQIKADVVFETIYIGLKQMEKSFPKNVKVELEIM